MTRAALALALALAAGCAAPKTPRLERFDPAAGYRYAAAAEGPDPHEEVFVALAFSGGGTRAAAFAYGALEALRDTPVGGGRTMLDEVDVISSVSGGSFAAAHFALFGPEAFFRDFQQAVLQRPIETDLALRLFAPWHWPALLSPWYGRGDLADDYYADAIFGERTFADLPARPFVVLNATDIARGAQLSFTQEHFDRLCADLSRVRVARAVTASSAFPVAFTPLTLENRPKASCGYQRPEWMEGAEFDIDISPQRYDLYRTWASYEDAAARPFVHVSDGGLSDNLGLRAIETSIFETDSWGLLPKINRGEVKHLIVIAVDAKPEPANEIDASARPPDIVTVLSATGTTPMENYSSDTVELFRVGFAGWDQVALDWENRRQACAALAEKECGARASCVERVRGACEQALGAGEEMRPPHPTLHFVHVRFESIPDDQPEKRQLKQVPTRLQLDAAQVELLRRWGRTLLLEAPAYREAVDAASSTSAEPRPSGLPCRCAR